MARLPYSRVVNVTMTRNQQFPSRRGFGVPILLTKATSVGKLDATYLTKVYGSMEEVAADWTAGTEPYKAGEAAFSQNPRPIQIKFGFIPSATATNAAMKTALDAIYAYDAEWYWIDVDMALRDTVMAEGVVEWTQAKNRLAIITTNNVLTKTLADTTCISAKYKGTVDRTATFYHPDTAENPGFALAAKLGTFNFDDANSAYTAKFKNIASLAPINEGSAAVQIITGFTPAIGQSISVGHMANAYVDIGGQFFVVEGSTLTPNVFIDEVHATDWIIARTEEEVLAILLNNARIPYTDVGMEQIASAARTVMRMASQAGLVASDLDPETGLYSPAVIITVPSVFSVTESQRKSRIAPAISVRFRYSGAIHYTTINYNMAF